MRYFVRSGSRNGFIGATGAEVSEEQRRKASAAFTLRGGESGLSLFEGNGPKEQRLVALALASQKLQIAPIDLIPVTDEDIARFGKIERTKGDTPLAKVNDWHHEIFWEQSRLDALVEHLLSDGRVATRIFPKDYREALRDLDLRAVSEQKAREWLEEQKRKLAT